MTRAIFYSLVPQLQSIRARKVIQASLALPLLIAAIEVVMCLSWVAIAAEPPAQPAPAPTPLTPTAPASTSSPERPPLLPDPTPLDQEALKPEYLPASAITAKTISETGLTVPSLWWMKEQYAAQEKFGDKLIENWIAYPAHRSQAGRVDVVLNRQLWSQLDYLQRYAFIHDFGSAARDYGYNVRVFDSRANFLAAYTCNFSPIFSPYIQSPYIQSPYIQSPYIQPAAALTCDTLLDFVSKANLRVRAVNPVGEDVSRVPGIGQR